MFCIVNIDAFITTVMFFPATVSLASVDLSFEYFGRRFNQHPLAIIDMPEPSDMGKVLRECFLEMHDLAVRGLLLKGKKGDEWLHKPFLKGHLADVVARFGMRKMYCF